MRKLFVLALVAVFAINLVACSITPEKGKWTSMMITDQTLPKGTIILANEPVNFPGDTESHEKNGKVLNGIILFFGDKLTNTTDSVWVYIPDYEVLDDGIDLVAKYQELYETDEVPLFYPVGH